MTFGLTDQKIDGGTYPADTDHLEASPSGGWRLTYAAMGVSA